MFNYFLFIIFIIGLVLARKLAVSKSTVDMPKQMDWAIKYLISSIILVGIVIFIYMVTI